MSGISNISIGGFFKPHYDEIRKSISAEVIDNFSKLTNDLARVKCVYELTCSNRINIEIEETKKDLEIALKYKNNGNNEFQKNNFIGALDWYNKSVLLVPQNEDRDMSIIIANRSAALYNLKQYRLAIFDIKMAMALQYPDELKYKIFERRAKCHLSQKENAEALLYFKKFLQYLDSSKLPLDKRQKMQMDIQIMIGMLTKTTKDLTVKEDLENTKTRNDVLPDLAGKRNEVFTSASSSVKIISNNKMGRFACAATNINIGDTLVTEKAHCAVLLPVFSLTHCQYCFLSVKAPIPCEKCTTVVYCSEICKNNATFHTYECGLLPTLWKSGCSITCQMALRIINQKNLQFFLDIKEKLFDTAIETVTKYKYSDYLTVYNLVRHEDKRSNEDFFHTTNMAVFLLNCLEKTNYFEKANTDDIMFIGSLILRHLQSLQFNAHEISELEMDPKNPKRADLAKSIFIGGGLYPTLALFNHSCDPGIVRYFHGTSIIARAVKNIKEGDLIAENYGPIFTETAINNRKNTLKELYWFDCQCTPCIQDWPLFDKMNPSILRFRCDAESYCPNIIPVNINSDEFMIKCGLCGQFTNILKGLKALQDTDAMFKTATRLVESGENQQALGYFIQILKLLDQTLAPPFKDYHLCQQGIRRCMLDYGNKCLILNQLAD